MKKQMKIIPWYEIPAERWRRRHRWEADSQRQKVYDAEARFRNMMLYHLDIKNKYFDSLDQIQRYVNAFISEAWFKKCFGVTKIIVERKKGHGADANKLRKRVRFSEHSRSLYTVLHEVAHVVNKDGSGGGHGRFYARTFMEFVRHVFGEEAVKLLRKAYKIKRVKYLPKRELSDETREKLRRNFKANVLKQKVEIIA